MPKTQQAVERAAELKIYLPQLDKLEEKLINWTEQERYQALVIRVNRYGTPIFEGCYGTSTNNSGVRTDTIFPVFSNSKIIIATLIMILLEDGCLKLEEPVFRFLPEFTGGGKENINIWHLLTHTSGLSGEGEVEHPPRKVMMYNNYGYQTLKDIICAITGESIDAYAQRVLFGPLGMIDSHWILPKEKWGRVLGRNERCMGYGWINSEECYTSESGAGGLKTTVNDMISFCEMIRNKGRYNGHRVLSPASVFEMTKNHNPEFTNPFDSWGLGWNYRSTKVDNAGDLRSASSIEHGGWAGHRFLVDPEYGLTVVKYSGSYGEHDGELSIWGRISNMIIAACE